MSSAFRLQLNTYKGRYESTKHRTLSKLAKLANSGINVVRFKANDSSHLSSSVAISFKLEDGRGARGKTGRRLMFPVRSSSYLQAWTLRYGRVPVGNLLFPSYSSGRRKFETRGNEREGHWLLIVM